MVDKVKSIREGIEKAISSAKKRNFVQGVDMGINFKNIDFSKPENRLKLDVILPVPPKKQKRVCLIAKDELVSKAKGIVDGVISPEQLEEFGKDKKKAKSLVRQYDVFIAQADLMPLVGKYLGQILAPKSKMPTPIPPTIPDLKPIVDKVRKTVQIRNKGKNLPVIHVCIGSEDMDIDALSQNAEAVLNAVINKLPQKKNNINDVYFKLTMGPVVRVSIS